MTKLQHKHAGIILAAGASSRMGEPKALLKTPSGRPLALHQAGLMHEAGIEDIVIVLGKDGERIQSELKDFAGCDESAPPFTVVQNPDWETGRITSIQAGAKQARCGHPVGAFILPVDTVGVLSQTIASLIDFANITPTSAVRPVESGQSGNLLWISGGVLEEVREINPHAGFRFDDWIAGQATALEVKDANIHNNVNTPEEWEAFKEEAFGHDR